MKRQGDPKPLKGGEGKGVGKRNKKAIIRRQSGEGKGLRGGSDDMVKQNQEGEGRERGRRASTIFGGGNNRRRVPDHRKRSFGHAL